jgi:hypothetical protein
MDDIITGLPTSLSNQAGRSISMPTAESIQKAFSIAPTSTTEVVENNFSIKTILTIVLVVIILGLLGLNIFTYLAKGTDLIGEVLSKIIKKTAPATKEIAKQSIIGTETVVDTVTQTTSNLVKDAGNILKRELHLERSGLWEKRDKGINNAIKNRDLNGINKFPEHEPTDMPHKELQRQYSENRSDDIIQEANKKGFCYIGTDRGNRSCIKINESDNCASGKIYPSMDICINPNLRE